MTQLMAGTEAPIMEETGKLFDYLEESWILTVRKRLKILDATIWIEDKGRLVKQRENDIGIICVILGISGINEDQLRAVNMYQIYLRVIMVSDMVNAQGTTIPQGRMMGQWRRESVLYTS